MLFPICTALSFILTQAAAPVVPVAPALAPTPDAAKLQKMLTDTQKQLEETRDAKDDAENRYKNLSTGKFIESGLTGGLALMLHSELSSSREGIKQRTSEIAAVPYLLFLPGYWGAKPETDKYCAGRFNAGAVEAQEAADSNAMRRAEVPLKAILSAAEAGRSLDETNLWIAGKDKNGKPKTKNSLSQATYDLAKSYVAERKSGDPSLLEARRDLLLRAVAAEVIGWIPGVPPRSRSCFARKFGAWIGVPINNFKARIEAPFLNNSTQDNIERDVRPVVSFGLGIAPNAIVTGLVGVSYSIVRLPSDPMDPKATSPYGYWSFTAGIGGNLDIINLFRRK